MEDKKEVNESEKGKNVLENGTYSIYGPDNGDVGRSSLSPRKKLSLK